MLHVDLDQFIVAVELLRRPELRGLPVLVGGSGDPTERGVVAGSSYEARAHRVVSGTPLRTAAARCPAAVFLPVDRDRYLAASAEVMDALRGFGVTVEEAGWDEAFLLIDTDDAEATARAVQVAVLRRSGLNCSIGIGDNKLRAKLAAAMAKPAGVFRLEATNWDAVMADRRASVLLGVGPKTTRKLSGLGIETVSQLAAADPDGLAVVFGPSTGPWLVALAHGADSAPVSDEPRRARSRGREITFQEDVRDPDRLRAELSRLSATVSGDMAQEGDLARRVVVKVRDSRFSTHTHGVGLPEPSRDAGVIECAALQALEAFAVQRPVRLVGVRAELE